MAVAFKDKALLAINFDYLELLLLQRLNNMIIAALMTLVIWFVVSLLRAVIKADRDGKEDADLGLFTYLASPRNAATVKPKRKVPRA